MADTFALNGAKSASIRRPRGRPAGSKNKPKPPVIINRDSSNGLKSQVIEITSGCDIGDCLITFAARKQRGVCVLSATGCVTNVTLRQPTSSGSIVTLHGRFEIVSLLGSVLPPPAPAGMAGLSVYLAGAQGQVVGGNVMGTLIASGPVVIMAATFTNAAFDRIPFEDVVDLAPGQNERLHSEVAYGMIPTNLVPNGNLASAPTCFKWDLDCKK